MPHMGQALGRRKGFEINVGFKWFGHGSPPLTSSGSSPVARDYGSWLVTLGASLLPAAQRRPAPVVRPSPPRLRTRYASETRMTAAGWLLPIPLCTRRSTLPKSITHLCNDMLDVYCATHRTALPALPLYPLGSRQRHQFRGIFPPVDRAGPQHGALRQTIPEILLHHTNDTRQQEGQETRFHLFGHHANEPDHDFRRPG